MKRLFEILKEYEGAFALWEWVIAFIVFVSICIYLFYLLNEFLW